MGENLCMEALHCEDEGYVHSEGKGDFPGRETEQKHGYGFDLV